MALSYAQTASTIAAVRPQAPDLDRDPVQLSTLLDQLSMSASIGRGGACEGAVSTEGFATKRDNRKCAELLLLRSTSPWRKIVRTYLQAYLTGFTTRDYGRQYANALIVKLAHRVDDKTYRAEATMRALVSDELKRDLINIERALDAGSSQIIGRTSIESTTTRPIASTGSRQVIASTGSRCPAGQTSALRADGRRVCVATSNDGRNVVPVDSGGGGLIDPGGGGVYVTPVDVSLAESGIPTWQIALGVVAVGGIAYLVLRKKGAR